MNIRLFLKGVLLYTTFIVYILSAMGIDDIYNKGYFLIDIVICAGLIYACYKTINKEELTTLLLSNHTEELEEDDEW